ncbi:MAG TPA: hypothetical protein VNF05_04855 [Acidimicrobiales bacterium]|nr:hypothetical protein [Acidimicrobiales bacterium]
MTNKSRSGFDDAILAIGVPVLCLTSLLEHYGQRLSARGSIRQYFDGVYASRVLGRESVIGLSNAANKFAALFGYRHESGLLAGWVLTNGIAFMVASILLYRFSAREDPRLRFAYLLIIAVMAASGVVVTPYDFLSYALIIAVFMAISSGRSWCGVVLMVLAVATRESALVVVPMLAVAAPGPLENGPGLRGQLLKGTLEALARTKSTLVVAMVGVSTYVALKIATLPRGRRPHFVQHVSTSGHWSVAGLVGVVTAVLMAIVIRWVVSVTFDRADVVARCRLLWLLSLPYLVVCLVWGIWGEAPRLVMPLVLGEFLIAASVLAPSSAVVAARERASA